MMLVKPEAYDSQKESAFDQSTYFGRVLHFIKFTSPKNALYSASEIERQKTLLKDYTEDNLEHPVSDKELWNAKYAVLSNTHPDTGDLIPRFFRMSYFVPCNVPIAIGLSISAPTPFNIALWQVINQSYNFGVNIANGNASNSTTNLRELSSSYGLAILSSVAIGLFAKRVISRSKYRDNAIFQRAAPYLGVASASVVNLFSSRFKDTNEGIVLNDAKTGESFPQIKSQKAGFQSFWQCALSRVMIPLPVIFLPSMIIAALTRRRLMPKSMFGNHLFNIGVSCSILMAALPLSLACFPQEVTVHKSELEPQFQNVINSQGEPVEHFSFNKGL
jgi:tricarboxylate carrier